MGGCGLDSSGSRDEGFSEHNNELSGSVKCGNCLE
jgi:hypothetical protein